MSDYREHLGQSAFLLGKAVALVEDIYISMRDPLVKNDYGHKMLLLKQDVNEFIKAAFKEMDE